MIPVQFITHETERYSYYEGAMAALRGGCKWIQLRMKEASDDDVRKIAKQLLPVCRSHQAVLLIDDRVELAKELETDGVHLGCEDMPIPEARTTLGEGFIIGGTANTLEDVLRLNRQGADYVGCGPFRFTKTKQKLSPVLGLDGYQAILQGLATEGIRIPIVAIGGIELDDTTDLMAIGVTGIAVSGGVLHAEDPVDMMNRFIHADEK